MDSYYDGADLPTAGRDEDNDRHLVWLRDDHGDGWSEQVTP